VGLGGETTAVPMLIIMLLCAALAAAGLVAASRAQGVRHSETVDV